MFNNKYLNNLTKDTTVIVKNSYDGTDKKTQGYYDEQTNSIILFLPAIKNSSPKNVLDVYYEQALKTAILHEYLHAVQKGNRLGNGGNPDIFLSYSDSVKDSIVADVKKHMPDVADRIKKYKMTKEEAYNYVAQTIYYGMGGEAGSFGYAFNTTSFVPWTTRFVDGKLTYITPWGAEYNDKGVIVKSQIAKMIVDEDMPDVSKPKTIRETITKAESKGNNLQYLYNAKKKEGAQVVFVDSRIKTMLVTLTKYMDKIDPHFAEQIRQGKIRTKSDIVNYIVNELPRDLDAKTNATIAAINRTYYKNANIKDCYAA